MFTQTEAHGVLTLVCLNIGVASFLAHTHSSNDFGSNCIAKPSDYDRHTTGPTVKHAFEMVGFK